MTALAHRLEAEQVYKAGEAADLLGISRATFFRIVWFKSRKVRIGRTVGYLASDLTLFQSLNRGA